MDENCADTITGHRREGPLVFRGGVRNDRPKLKAEFCAGGLGGLQKGPVRGGGMVQEDANPAHLRQGLLENLEPLCIEIGQQYRQPRHVPAGPREAGHMPEANGVGMGHENDGDRAGRPPGRLGLGRGGCDDDVDLHAGQFRCRFAHLLDRPRPSELDDQVLALDIAQIAQACSQYLDPAPIGRVAEAHESETRALGLLLRARKRRPREPCRGGKRDQLRGAS